MFPMLAKLEFLGQSYWWAGVVGVTGVALLLYALLLFRDAQRAATQEPASRSFAAAPPEKLALFGLPLGFVALLAALTCFGLTPLVLLTGSEAATLGALLWTLLITLTAVFLFYRRVYHYLSTFRMGVLFALRTAAILGLVTLLFQPLLATIRNPELKPKLSVVIDASGSMSISDQPNEPNRYRQAVLAVNNTLIPRLADKYAVQLFAYDGKHVAPLRNSDEYDQIPPNGTVTDLTAAIGLGTSSGAGQVILFSDGIHNGPTAVSAGLSSITVPVNTVRVGSSAIEPTTVPDIAVVSVDSPQTATVNNQVVLTASIKSTAMSDRTIKVQLLAPGSGAILDEQRLVLHSGPTPQTVQLKFTPDKVGRMSVRVNVPVDPEERSAANNQQEVPLLVTDPKLAVIYIEGRVRPEVGPLRRALEMDPNVNAISMVQTQAGKFELRGVKEGDDLRGVPTTLAQWKRFKVIILGDLDASFLTPQQLKDIEQAVREGAGLLMIGGQRSFAPGGWSKTTLATVLPVSLDKVTPEQIDAKFVPQLTGAGNAHPIFRNIAPYFTSPDGKKNEQQMPDLSGCVALASAKAGASVLAVHPTEKINGQPAIVLAVQQYSNGRSAAFAADTTWHWNLFLRGMGKDSPYNRFWGQMVRWLASQDDMQKKTGSSVTSMIPKERYESGEPVMLRAAVTDKEGQSTAYANVTADVTGPDGKTMNWPLAPVPDQVGLYEARYQPRLAGAYKVTFIGTKDKTELGKDQTGFSVLQAAGEMEVLAAQPMTLQEISRGTGGSFVELSAVSALADRLIASLPTTALSLKTTTRLYHFRGFFLFVVLFLGLEIFLRRKWQLQ